MCLWHPAAEADAVENVCEMEVCEAASLTAVANKSLDMSRSLTEKIAADAADSDDDDARATTPVDHGSTDKQVVELCDCFHCAQCRAISQWSCQWTVTWATTELGSVRAVQLCHLGALPLA